LIDSFSEEEEKTIERLGIKEEKILFLNFFPIVSKDFFNVATTASDLSNLQISIKF